MRKLTLLLALLAGCAPAATKAPTAQPDGQTATAMTMRRVVAVATQPPAIYVKVGNNQPREYVEALVAEGLVPLWHDGTMKAARNLGYARGPIEVSPWDHSSGGPADLEWWEAFIARCLQVRGEGATWLAYDFEPRVSGGWPHDAVPHPAGMRKLLSLEGPVVFWRGTGRLFNNPCGEAIDKALAVLPSACRVVRPDDLHTEHWLAGRPAGIIVHFIEIGGVVQTPEQIHSAILRAGLYGVPIRIQGAAKFPLNSQEWVAGFDAIRQVRAAWNWRAGR
jgi:hypothetical protein